ncbi:MAG: OmpA family protein [Flavobacteriaceae bacterium]|nr:OmpA family protein [Flavobacteriaceae bacterium]
MKKMKKLFLLLIMFTIDINAQEMFKDFKIKSISANNKHENFGASFYKNNSIVFSSASGGNLHLYEGKIIDGDVDKHQIFLKGSKNNTHESNVAFTSNFKTVYFTRSLYGKEKNEETLIKKTIAIFRATVNNNGTWKNIMPMPFNNKNYDVGHPTLNIENTKLYFSSNKPGGFGKTDIYVVNILPNGKYSEPQNLGPSINTTGNELHPFISGDNFLYFSSNGYQEGLGGLDIFVSQVNDKGVSQPEHVNSPINTRWDDFSFIIDYTKRIGFFSSNRPGGLGLDDIYYFKEIINEEFVKKKIERGCNETVNGYVFINGTQKKIVNALVNLVNSSGEKINNFTTGNDAKFRFDLKCNEKYYVEAAKEGYKTYTKSIKTTSIDKKSNNLNLFLEKIKGPTTPKVRKLKYGEIGFNFNEARLLKRHTYQLDKAIILMLANPKLHIEIESHTDSRGEDEFNMNLTRERIDALIEYIGFKGVSIRKIKGIAYGETKPINNCVNGIECTEEEFLINRRTTFKLIKK